MARQSEQINDLAAALAKAQGAIEGAVKGKENPHFRSKYADLGAVWDACREHLTANGIAVVQPVVRGEDGSMTTVTRLIHASGQWIEDGGIPLLLSKNDMQGLGSALTYSRRYGLMSMVGVAPEDDDGNAASAKAPAKSAPKPIAALPDGFQDWLADLEAVADEGTVALQKAWKASAAVYRDYLTKTLSATWEAIKAKAAKVPA